MPKHELKLSPLPINETEILSRFEKNHTAIVHDVMNRLDLSNTTLPWNLKPLVDGSKACGIAFTVKGMPWHAGIQSDEMEQRAFMSEYHMNCIPVWDCGGDIESAHYGEMMSAQSMVAGCRAAIVDGGIRDTDRIMEMGFKIWAKYRSPHPMVHYRIIDWQIPVKIGNVTVKPGDLIFADMDGIITIPRERAFEVLMLAEEDIQKEKGWREILKENLTVNEALRRGVLF